jgi:hypothetical protein
MKSTILSALGTTLFFISSACSSTPGPPGSAGSAGKASGGAGSAGEASGGAGSAGEASGGAGFAGEASGGEPSMDQPCGTDDGMGCAPDSERVDLYEPTFSNPTQVTNPLFPIANLHSVVFLGTVDGQPFRTETTLLPTTRMVTWNGEHIETLSSQYMAFSNGRIQELATDWYAQDDKGAVWYFGEDVADYDQSGTVTTNEGTWFVGRDNAPLTMIMPSKPKLGDVFRAENVAPLAWEEVTVQAVAETRNGPSGLIQGVMVGSELHMDGTRQEKLFAPGYGEYSTGSLETDDLEALALAIPTDALTSALPSELEALSTASANIFVIAGADSPDWPAAAAELATLTSAWEAYSAEELPAALEAQLAGALTSLGDAVVIKSASEARAQAIAVARATFDFRLRHQPPSEIDWVRLDLWLAQALLDAGVGHAGATKGSVVTAQLVWDRISHTFADAKSTEISGLLRQLIAAAAAENQSEVMDVAGQLRTALADGGWK